MIAMRSRKELKEHAADLAGRMQRVTNTYAWIPKDCTNDQFALISEFMLLVTELADAFSEFLEEDND